MSKNISFCELIQQIKVNPFKKVEGLTVSNFYLLQQHLLKCEACSEIVDKVMEKYKDIPSDPNSDWNKTQYN
jgi:hypothetical protein